MRMKIAIGLVTAVAISVIPTNSFAEDLPPYIPAGPNVPPPLFNPDGSKYIPGVSPEPMIPTRNPDGTLIDRGPGTLPDFIDADPNLPPPLYNPDGTPYIEGVSPKPMIPTRNPDGTLIERAPLTVPRAVVSYDLKKTVDAEIKNTDLSIEKTDLGYRLDFEETLSAVDSGLKVFASKKGAKTQTLKISLDINGQIILPTKKDLSGFKLQIKRGAKVLKTVKITN